MIGPPAERLPARIGCRLAVPAQRSGCSIEGIRAIPQHRAQSLPQHARDGAGRQGDRRDTAKAQKAYEKLVTLVSADSSRPELSEAKAFLAN